MSPDVVPLPGTTGLIALMACPGRERTLLTHAGVPGQGLRAELEALASWGARGMLTLMEQGELDALGLADMGEQARAAGLRWWHMPITDFCAPDSRFEAAWRRDGPAILDELAQGQHLAIHCLAGLGRTGTVAARILVDWGEPPEAAIQRVRQARPGTIQSEEQLKYITALRAG